MNGQPQFRRIINGFGTNVGVILSTLLTIVAASALVPALSYGAGGAAAEDLVDKVKQTETSAGFHPTGNFARADPRLEAYYRCYYTGLLELPGSYVRLKLRQGFRDGCPLDAKKYDVFFYPMESEASGHVPITQSLAESSPSRMATVVSHEDFHEQVRALPDSIAEAAATLAGFITGAAALSGPELQPEAGVFLRKALLINRYYDRLHAVYQAFRRGEISKSAALSQKQEVFRALQEECRAIQPEPRTFNKCVAAPNNAGLAFDHTYTEYYPLLYQVLMACRQDLRCTIGAILRAPKKASETAVARYLASFSEPAAASR